MLQGQELRAQHNIKTWNVIRKSGMILKELENIWRMNKNSSGKRRKYL